MNRLQTRMAIILLPRTLFVSAGKSGKGFGNMKIIYEETSSVWINVSMSWGSVRVDR